MQSSNHEHRYARQPAMQNRIVVSSTKTKSGDKLLAVAGLTAWNSQPDFVKDSNSFGIFKSRPKKSLDFHTTTSHC